MARQGQVTIFFAIGIVLLIVILLAVYIGGLIGDDGTITSGGGSTAQARQYLTQCLDTAFYNAIELVGQRGGYFFDEDVDIDVPPAGEQTSTPDGPLHYAITGDNSRVEPPPTLADIAPYTDLRRITFSNIFGKVVMPGLCDPGGPNGILQGENAVCGSYSYARAGEHSIQAAMQNKLAKELEACMDRDVQDQTGTDFDTYGAPIVEVVFGRQTITATTTFPDGPSGTPDVKSTIKVRLLTLYDYMMERLYMNVRHPQNLIVDNTGSNYYAAGFSIGRSPFPGGSGPDQLFTFQDNNNAFRLRGMPLAINALVEDRPPYTDNSAVDPADWVTADPDD